MPTIKIVKRKLKTKSPYRQALHELALLQSTLDVLHPSNGDTILFKLGDHSRMTNEMIRVFLDVASQRGMADINAFLMKPGDAVEKLSDEAFDQLARMKGYVREVGDAVSEQGSASGVRDRLASPGEAESGESGFAQDVEDAIARLCEYSGEGAAEAQGVRTEEAEGVIQNAQERGVLLPVRDVEQASPCPDEGEDGREETEGFRAEETPDAAVVVTAEIEPCLCLEENCRL
jgi:hypothetical protein